MNVTFWPCNKVPTSSQLIHNNDLQYCTCTKWQKNANLFDLQIHVILDLLCHPPDHPRGAGTKNFFVSLWQKTSFLDPNFSSQRPNASLSAIRALWHFNWNFLILSVSFLSDFDKTFFRNLAWPTKYTISILSDYGRTKYLP